MVTKFHATPQMTNQILRGYKKKKHMKNKNKNNVKGYPGITLYPSPKFKKYSENQQDKYHTSMKNNNGFDKKHKNIVYNERNQYQILRSKFEEFYKRDMSPEDFNEKVDKYYSEMNSTESENIKSAYSKFYHIGHIKSEVKYKEIQNKYNEKKKIKSIKKDKCDYRESVINRLEDKIYKDLKMEEKMNNAKAVKRIEMINNILIKSGYTSVDQYINSNSDKDIVF
tara:strand:- start:16 stop:690 length:675 start_codon:yes stop_codon:yes gene_type:complete